MKSTSFSKNSSVRFLFIFILVSFFCVSVQTNGLAQENNTNIQNESAQSATTAGQLTQISDIKTFWSLTKLGGGISMAIFIVLAVGIFLIVIQIYELILDKIRGRILMATHYRQMSLSEMSKLLKRHPNNLISRLYAVLLSIFHTTGTTRDFHDEIANYIQLQQDRFGSFKSRLSFLSDTAGALGLLGTVWGMFVTFFGGNLDSQRILNGMGLALVTTLIGLVVSIILNFFATEVFSFFNKRLELIASKADEFRLWLMAIAHHNSKKNNNNSPPNGGLQRKQPEPTDSGRAKSPSFSLKAVSDFKHDGTIGQRLHDPITVMVEANEGQIVAGMAIRYEVIEGGGLLDNRNRAALVKTDNRGMAHLHWTLGEQVGPQKLRVSIPNFHADQLEFVSFAQPFIPNLTGYGHDLSSQAPKRGAIS